MKIYCIIINPLFVYEIAVTQTAKLANNSITGLRLWVWLMVFNATFNNISVILWRSVLLVKETGVPRENHRPVPSHWQLLHIMLYRVHIAINSITLKIVDYMYYQDIVDIKSWKMLLILFLLIYFCININCVLKTFKDK